MKLHAERKWRYCATRPNGDVFVVLYFQDQRVIDKANYTLQLDRQGDENSRRDTVDRIYTDRPWSTGTASRRPTG